MGATSGFLESVEVMGGLWRLRQHSQTCFSCCLQTSSWRLAPGCSAAQRQGLPSQVTKEAGSSVSGCSRGWRTSGLRLCAIRFQEYLKMSNMCAGSGSDPRPCNWQGFLNTSYTLHKRTNINVNMNRTLTSTCAFTSIPTSTPTPTSTSKSTSTSISINRSINLYLFTYTCAVTCRNPCPKPAPLSVSVSLISRGSHNCKPAKKLRNNGEQHLKIEK